MQNTENRLPSTEKAKNAWFVGKKFSFLAIHKGKNKTPVLIIKKCI